MRGRLLLTILFSILILSVFVNTQEEVFVDGEKDPAYEIVKITKIVQDNPNFITETITCKFNDIRSGKFLTEETNCFNSFHYGNMEIPKVEVTKKDGTTYESIEQYQCKGTGECSITIKGEKGTKMKWGSFCMEMVSDAKIKSWIELIKNPDLTTTIDGTDKVVNLECASKSFAGMILTSFKFIREFLLKLRYSGDLGVRNGYVLCNNGEEIILDNDAPFCKTTNEMFDILEQQCEGKCAIDSNNCGAAGAYYYSGCDLKNPEKDVEIVNI